MSLLYLSWKFLCPHFDHYFIVDFDHTLTLCCNVLQDIYHNILRSETKSCGFWKSVPFEMWQTVQCFRQVHQIACWSSNSVLKFHSFWDLHYSGVIMSRMASQITDVSMVCSIVCSCADQSSASLAFVRGIHRLPVNSPHKRASNAEMFPFDDIIMHKSYGQTSLVIGITAVYWSSLIWITVMCCILSLITDLVGLGGIFMATDPIILLVMSVHLFGNTY